jgi:hypothetical protein
LPEEDALVERLWLVLASDSEIAAALAELPKNVERGTKRSAGAVHVRRYALGLFKHGEVVNL